MNHFQSGISIKKEKRRKHLLLIVQLLITLLLIMPITLIAAPATGTEKEKPKGVVRGEATAFKQTGGDHIIQRAKQLENKHRTFAVHAGTTKGEGNIFFMGDTITFEVNADEDCYLLWFNVNRDGIITILLPNDKEQGNRNFLRKGKTYQIPGREIGEHFNFEVQPPPGTDYQKFIGFKQPFSMQSLIRGPIQTATGTIEKSEQFLDKLETLLKNRTDWTDTSIEIKTKNIIEP